MDDAQLSPVIYLLGHCGIPLMEELMEGAQLFLVIHFYRTMIFCKWHNRLN